MKYSIALLLFLSAYINTEAQYPQFYRSVLNNEFQIVPYGITALSDGAVILIRTWNTDSASPHFISLIKINRDGDTLWTQNYLDGKAGFLEVKPTFYDNGFIIMSKATSTGFDGLTTLIKTDSLGEVLWANNYWESQGSFSNYFACTSDSGIAILGWPSTEPRIYKLDKNGMFESAKVINSPFVTLWTPNGNKLTATSDGGFAVIGRTGDSLGGDYVLVKFDSWGDLSWSKRYDYAGEEQQVYSIAETKSGNLIMTGFNYDPFLKGFNFVVITDSLGFPLNALKGTNVETGPCLNVLALDTGFILYRKSHVRNLASYDESGNTLWNTSTGDGVSFGWISADTDGNVYMSGMENNSNNTIFTRFDSFNVATTCPNPPLTLDFSEVSVNVQPANVTVTSLPYLQTIPVTIYKTFLNWETEYLCGAVGFKEPENVFSDLIKVFPVPSFDQVTVQHQSDNCKFKVAVHDVTGEP